MIYTKNEYLAHHGVEKQKWGDRNGPPYPLHPEQMSSAQKRANANEGWFKRKIREAKEAKQIKKEAKEAKKVEEKLAKQAHKQGRLSEQERKDVYNRADVKTAYEHISEYSNKEIQSILDRYEMQRVLGEKVSNLNYKEKTKGKEKIDIAAKYLESAVNIGRKAADIYNIAAAVGNALGDKQWKPIRIGEFPRNDNKKDNDFESKLSDEKKQEIFKKADLNKANKYKEELSNKELQNIIDRHYKYQAIDKAIAKENKSDDNSSDNKSQKQNNYQQNQNKNQNSYSNNYNKSYNSYNKSKDSNYNKPKDNSYSKPKDTTTETTATKSTTVESKTGKTRGTKSTTWSVVGSTSGDYSDFLSNNASSGESWVSTYFDNYSKPKTRTSLSTNTKTSYSDNHVKDSSGNTYRMITTSPTGLTGVDKNYVTSGEKWFSNWSATSLLPNSYGVYDDKMK